MGNCVKNNPLRTRDDVERAAVELIEPLLPLLSSGKARLHLGDTGAAYSDDIAQMEAFARPLWAIVPMLAGGCQRVKPLWEAWREGIENGTDPQHPEYWGRIASFDQRQVEMAVFGYGMAIAPQEFFFSLSQKAQKNLYDWLNQINDTELYHNNWIYFRVLVNIGFMTCGLPHNEERMKRDFEALETHYEGDGWYYDLPGQLDYYTPWAFHYYGLIYAAVMKERDPERSALLLERAKLIAPDIACWFDDSGEALPYGRSLTYRFAQSAFFSALALAQGSGKTLGYGQMKRLLLSNMRKWFSKPIFTRDGVLTIGYGYPNLLMAEGYNAPGSPYWALKAFACLALKAEHPFWNEPEKLYPAPAVLAQKHMRMLVARSPQNDHVIAYPAGNCCEAHAHCDAKYEKFAYSTVFGFSVPKTQKNLAGGAFDSMLALSEDGIYWHTRYQAKEYILDYNRIISVWKPLSGIKVRTTIMPVGNWHLRIHVIETNRAVQAVEGGFAIARDGQGEAQIVCDEQQALAFASWGVSGIKAVQGYEKGEVIRPEPNTNLMTARTLLPVLRVQLPPGKHRLCCVVYGSPAADAAEFENVPQKIYDVLDEKGKKEMTRIEVMRGGEIFASASGEKEAQLLLRSAYQLGDEIHFVTDYDYAIVQVDQAVKPARVYLPTHEFTYRLPLEGINPAVYAPGSFEGDMHLCSIKPDHDNSYRNLARNPADQRGDVTCYPHATANVETRDESWFCARNTIDGEHIADGHGPWPYGSWGIGARTDAELTLDFGREVEVDKMVLYLRADFPHDAYWIQGTVLLDDGAEITFPLEGINGPQEIDLGGKHRIRSLKLHKLIKCDNPSAFPALRQIEVYGVDL